MFTVHLRYSTMYKLSNCHHSIFLWPLQILWSQLSLTSHAPLLILFHVSGHLNSAFCSVLCVNDKIILSSMTLHHPYFSNLQPYNMVPCYFPSINSTKSSIVTGMGTALHVCNKTVKKVFAMEVTCHSDSGIACRLCRLNKNKSDTHAHTLLPAFVLANSSLVDLVH